MRRARNIARDALPNGPFAAEIDQRERHIDLDLCIAPDAKLVLVERIVADDAIAAVSKDRFEKAHFERLAEIEDAKPAGGDAPARIAEPAWRFAKAKRVGMAIKEYSAKPRPRVDGRQMQRGAFERRCRMQRFRHSSERFGDAFGRLDDLRAKAQTERVAARHAIKLRMTLDEEAVDRPRTVAKAFEERG